MRNRPQRTPRQELVIEWLKNFGYLIGGEVVSVYLIGQFWDFLDYDVGSGAFFFYIGSGVVTVFIQWRALFNIHWFIVRRARRSWGLSGANLFVWLSIGTTLGYLSFLYVGTKLIQ